MIFCAFRNITKTNTRLLTPLANGDRLRVFLGLEKNPTFDHRTIRSVDSLLRIETL
ncbi:MAG: hypothetical protein AAGU75_06785 [Bacillota bacterium]